MRLPIHAPNRSAAVTVEAAIILPVLFLLFIGLLAGGMMVFKNDEVSHIARETARFAVVHGGQYAKNNNAAIQAGTLPNVDGTYLVNYAKSKVVTLDPGQLTVSVQMLVITPGATSPTSTETVTWDNTAQNQNRSPYSVWTNTSTDPATNVEESNICIVQVSYAWNPGIYLLGPITLTSTATMPMSY